jgi:hypothetical protein
MDGESNGESISEKTNHSQLPAPLQRDPMSDKKQRNSVHQLAAELV